MKHARTRLCFLRATLMLVPLAALRSAAAGAEWEPGERCLQQLVRAVPSILKAQSRETGRFGTEPWITEDQNVLFPLAAAWSLPSPSNPYYHDPLVFEAIIKGGDALADTQDKSGSWTYRKKDNSTWGQTLEPWAFSRWMRAYLIVREAMPAGRREKWERSLLLGCRRLAGALPTSAVHNKTVYHAATVYCAGLCFKRDDWRQVASEFMAKAVAAQSPGGWWSEHSGPVVEYNTVYVEALGIYYALSHDASVLEALRRSAVYHATFTYPDGSSVETLDERNPFQEGVAGGNVGFSFTPEGRAYLLRQSALLGERSYSADEAASYLLYGAKGLAVPPAAETESNLVVVGNSEALVLRRKPWFVCLSAFTCEPSDSRWIQDRQNFVSIFHDRAGLIVGGGNTKLQPFWSNFTVGDTALLRHCPGDEKPDFSPKGQLVHLPSAGRLRADKEAPGLDFEYGDEQCRITVYPRDDQHLALVLEATAKTGRPVEGHVVFLPRKNGELKTAAGRAAKLGLDSLEWREPDMGGWFEYGGVRVGIPSGARLLWPAKHHNPYRKNGRSDLKDARLVLCVPFSTRITKQEVTLEL